MAGNAKLYNRDKTQFVYVDRIMGLRDEQTRSSINAQEPRIYSRIVALLDNGSEFELEFGLPGVLGAWTTRLDALREKNEATGVSDT